jgi:hypothetical protein
MPNIIRNANITPHVEELLNVISKVPNVISIEISNLTEIQLIQISSSTYSFEELPLLYNVVFRKNGEDRPIRFIQPIEYLKKIRLEDSQQTINNLAMLYGKMFDLWDVYYKAPRYLSYDGALCDSLAGGYIIEPMSEEEIDQNLINLLDFIKNNIPRIIKFTVHLIVDQTIIFEPESVAIKANIAAPEPRDPGAAEYYGASRTVSPSEFNDTTKYSAISEYFQDIINTKFNVNNQFTI